jgi:hypothetical protein
MVTSRFANSRAGESEACEGNDVLVSAICKDTGGKRESAVVTLDGITYWDMRGNPAAN